MYTKNYDVLIVGARAAGAATAMLMARKGLNVLVVDWAEPGSDTVSSHNLTRGACLQLDRWGIAERLLAAGTPWIERTTLHFGETAYPIDLRAAGDAPGMMGTRRPILDTTLVDAAKEAGADFTFNTSFRDVVRDAEDRVCGAVLTDETGIEFVVRAGLVVGADGVRSLVARRVGAATRKQSQHVAGHIYSYFKGLPLHDNHACFSRNALIAATPTDDDAFVVIATTSQERLRAMRSVADSDWVLRHLAREANPEFGAFLDRAKRVEAVRVFNGINGHVRDCAGAGWALVGDAGYFRDPITAHGLTDAFRDAELLADAAASRSDAALDRYQIDRDAVTEEIWELTDRIASFELDLDGLQAAYQDLAYAMRTEQAWMDNRFNPPALAA